MIHCPHCNAPSVYLYPSRTGGIESVKCLRCGEYKEREIRRHTPRPVPDDIITDRTPRSARAKGEAKVAALESTFSLLDVFNFKQFLDACRCGKCAAMEYLHRQLREGRLARFKGPKGAYVYCRLDRPLNPQEAAHG